ncbi:DUF3987 domain-containing protein [bacterium]|nr:DUF3987 domain-containing protein [bacterium]
MILSSRPDTGELIAQAKSYAARGWYVVPVHTVADDGACTCGNSECSSKGKHPIPNDWPNRATRDAATIDDYWSQAPIANVGIVTGAVSGIFVIDMDGTDGIAGFNKLAEEHGEPPPTYTVISGSGGVHLYYRYPRDRTIGNRQKITGRAIDVRGDGGQVLAPPSLHSSGGRYTLDHDIEPAEAPAWLLDLIAPPPESGGVVAPRSDLPSSPGSMVVRVTEGGADLPSRIRAYLAACPAAISGEAGHNQTFAVTNALIHGFALSVDESLPFLQEWNQTCQPPWSDKELRHKLADSLSKGAPPPGKERGYLVNSGASMPTTSSPTTKRARILPIEPWVTFPVDALPEPLRSLVVEGARALGCVTGYLAPYVLAIVAGMIGNTRRIRLKKGWTEPAIVWSAVVADSGSLKSPALDLVSKVIHQHQSRMFDDHRAEQSEYEAALAKHERDVSDWKKSKGKQEPPAKPVAPVCRRILVADITVEKLAVILGDNPRGILCIRDELAGWFQSFNQYKSGGGGDVANWLELHRAGSLTVDRKSGPTIHVRQATVSLTGGIQPAILAREFTAANRESGLAARILLAMPPKERKEWTDAELPEHVETMFHTLIDRLISLEPKVDAEGDASPWLLDLTPEAKRRWIEYYNRWGAVQTGAEGDLAAMYAKIEAYAPRLALLHHVVDRVHQNKDDISYIGEESIAAGIRLADWFAQESKRVYSILSETAEERSLRTLRDLIARKGGMVTPRELQRANDRLYRTSEDAQAALIRLQEAGLGTIVIDTPTTGGHATWKFTLFDARRPTCLTLDQSSIFLETPEPSDTRSDDVTNSLENGASVGRVMRQAGGSVENSESIDESASVRQTEEREVFTL